MFKHRSQQTPNGKRKMSTKLIGGFTALAATAVITAGGFAAASPNGKPTKEQCIQAGYTNYGQCVKDWAHNKPGGGYGGGNTSVATNINLNINNSNHNIIQVIVNIFR